MDNKIDIMEFTKYMSESISSIIEPIDGKGGLYLGNFASLVKSTKKYNIQAVVSIYELTKFQGLNIQINNHLAIDLEDSEETNILQHFEQTNNFIMENIQTGNVLVHCLAGISRSATIVIAFIMWNRKLLFKDAYQFVASKRDFIYPNDEFRQQLKEYEKQLNIESK